MKSIMISFVVSYYGMGTEFGECGIRIMTAAHNDSGTWSCHMGIAHAGQTDAVKEISVRITGKLFIIHEIKHSVKFNEKN